MVSAEDYQAMRAFYADRLRRTLKESAEEAAAQWVDLPAAPRPTHSRDPDDDIYLHTALHGKTEWLISGNRDLLDLPAADWRFEILSPAQALEKWHQK